jgi:S-DNA-T family DNA segregation ATPase FtsK/SpoIIIE
LADRRGSKRRGEPGARTPGRLEAEAVAIALVALAVFALGSLLSFDARDPWWGFGARVRNLCGPLGATLARALRGALGLAAHVLPLALVVAAARYLRGLPLRPRWVPLCAWGAVWLSLAGLLETAARLAPTWFGPAPGGLVGRAIGGVIERALHPLGSLIALALVLGVGLLVATGASLRDVGRASVRATGRVGDALRQHAVVGFVRLRRRLRERLLALAERREQGGAARASGRPAGEPRAAASPLARPGRAPRGEPEVVERAGPLEPAPRQRSLPLERPAGGYELPELEMLARGADEELRVDRESLIRNSQILEKKLSDFNVSGRVVKVHPGPVITMYEFEPAPGIKLSRITALSDDLALALRALSVRIVAPIPGKSVVGIEVPNTEREVVVLRDLLAHASYQEAPSKLTVALGKDIFGTPVTADLARMPHLLVAGATGSGKSVFLNALLCSIFFKSTPDEVKLLLIDPKMLEFSNYRGVPHLIADVVTDPKRASAALLGIVKKMEERYRLMAERGVRNVDQYNRALRKELSQGARPVSPETGEPLAPLPLIVVVIDELADLMIVAARDVEESVMRLAQMARAAGIHLVLATQRPSVDVLTGVIKANFPSRIVFQVSSRTDSRTVIDQNGAERLLGLGDMLFTPPGSSIVQRIHGPYVSEREVQAVVDFWREQGRPEFDETLIRQSDEEGKADPAERDELFDAAVDVVARHRIASISFVQRKLKIGYNRAARIFEQLENEGVVGPQDGTKPREIYVRAPEE